ncbi:outer membrane beta-barrel protein [Soonwooa sp.]|uniref:outer membrane beta-barrel protein n=1 Tax=Soonwooa sp. TaxID=1938592 RepID=UPI002610C47A|nr:outer membrane beta-barrel protein [Soonwooa sp.]
MRRLILLASIVGIGLLKAQVPKGTQYVSGQIGFSTTKNHSNNSSVESYKFLPTYGYFFAPSWAIVMSAGYKQETEKTQSQNANLDLQDLESVSSALVVTPSLRRFWVLDDKFSLFCQLDFPLEFGNVKSTSRLDNSGVEVSSTKNSYSSYGVSVKPGIDYFLNRRWKIAASLGEIGYYNTHFKESNTNKNRFNFEGNFSSVQFAVKYIIPAKK